MAEASNHPGIIYRLAEAHCQTGDTAKALHYLQTLVSQQLTYPLPENPAFAALAGNATFQELSRRFREGANVVHPSQRAFTLPDKTLIPEGMAYDPASGRFLVGSLAQHKIVMIDKKGRSKDFIRPGQGGIWRVLGMKTDPARKQLWVCSASEKDTTDGYSGVFRYDLKTGKLKKKYVEEKIRGGCPGRPALVQ